MKDIDYDDKDLVIVAVCLLGFTAIIAGAFGHLTDQAVSVVQNAFSGLFGIAVGRATAKAG